MTKHEPLVWRKSSYSGGGGGSCVEVAWRKSSYSGGGTGNCVEVANGIDAISMRDSKNASGPTITVTPAAWRAFVATTRS
jgi:hypothetical protein